MLSDIIKEYALVMLSNILSGNVHIPNQEDLGLPEEHYLIVKESMKLTVFFCSCVDELSNNTVLNCSVAQGVGIIINILESLEKRCKNIHSIFIDLYESIVYLIPLCCIIYFQFHTDIDEEELERKIDQLSWFISEKTDIPTEQTKRNLLMIKDSVIIPSKNLN